jgi:hypothetical protein
MAHIEFGNQIINAAQVLKLLAGYQMLPQLCRLLIIDRAIAGVQLTPEEKANTIEQFYQKNQLTTPSSISILLG